MGSSYNGADLFGSGPHRFVQGAWGELVVANLALGSSTSGLTALGPIPLAIKVEGRLVAGDAGSVWELAEGIRAALADPPTAGLLVDQMGREYDGIALVKVEFPGPMDMGRVASLAYVASFAVVGT